MASSHNWLRILNETEEANQEKAIRDLIISFYESIIPVNGGISQVDLSGIDKDCKNTLLLTTFLRCTYRFKDSLPGWSDLAQRTKDKLIDQGLASHSIMRGLI